MKRFLLMLFLSINVFILPNLINNYQAIKDKSTNSDLNIKAKKTYQLTELAIGFDSIITIADKLFTVDINNNQLEIYQVINNNLQLLATYQSEKQLQLGSVQSYQIDSKIYYEVFIKTDENNVSSIQYFIFDINTLVIKNLGIFSVAPKTSRYIYDNSNDKIYHYQNYLVFLHLQRWYVNSSTTIINLANNKVSLINSNSGVFMSFSDGLLYYSSKGLTVLNIITNERYYLTDALQQQLYNLYATNQTVYVTGKDLLYGEYCINLIQIIDHKLVLIKLLAIKEGNIDAIYMINNSIYFAGQIYNYKTNESLVYLYKFAKDSLVVIQTYHLDKNLLLDTNAYYQFHDNYFDIVYATTNDWQSNQLNLTRYDLTTWQQTNKKFDEYYVNSVNFLAQKTLFSLTTVSDNVISTYIGQYDW